MNTALPNIPSRRETVSPEEWALRVDLAAAYINAALSPEVQSKMADAPYFVAPISSKAVFSKGLQTYAADMKALEAMNGVDWAKLNPRRAEYIDRFNREVKV